MTQNNGETETVEISVETAEIMQSELRILIERTDAVEENGDCMSPLARAKQRIEARMENAFTPQVKMGMQSAVSVIDTVAKETGEEPTPIDPLCGHTFEALQELDEVFDE